MGIEVAVDEGCRLTRITVVGAVTFDEMKEAIEGFWQSPRLTRDVRWDYRDADMRGISRTEQEALVTLGLKYRCRHAERAGGKTAIIASGHLEFAMNRASEALSESRNYPFVIRTFRTVEEADAWLATEEEGARS